MDARKPRRWHAPATSAIFSTIPTNPPHLLQPFSPDARTVHRLRLPSHETCVPVCLLQRLKTRFIAACGSSGHPLLFSALTTASKVIYDDTYSNKSRCIVSQGMLALREINQMEQERRSYLPWQLDVGPDPRSLPPPFQDSNRISSVPSL